MGFDDKCSHFAPPMVNLSSAGLPGSSSPTALRLLSVMAMLLGGGLIIGDITFVFWFKAFIFFSPTSAILLVAGIVLFAGGYIGFSTTGPSDGVQFFIGNDALDTERGVKRYLKKPRDSYVKSRIAMGIHMGHTKTFAKVVVNIRDFVDDLLDITHWLLNLSRRCESGENPAQLSENTLNIMRKFYPRLFTCLIAASDMLCKPCYVDEETQKRLNNICLMLCRKTFSWPPMRLYTPYLSLDKTSVDTIGRQYTETLNRLSGESHDQGDTNANATLITLFIQYECLYCLHRVLDDKETADIHMNSTYQKPPDPDIAKA
jgi:hypothetical protein